MQKGFTLIELAIVMVIIGLTIGGILTGRDLIRTAEVRSMMTDIERFKTAFATFRGKYDCIPGDCINATTFLGGTTTNGNGNGTIDYLLGAPGEEYNVWQQLALANLIPGTYTGGPTSLPTGKISGSYYRVSYQAGVYKTSANMFSINSMDTTYNLAHNAILSPTAVTSLDVKFDDGLADSGQIMGFNVQGVPGCVTNDYTAGLGTYISGSEFINCKIFFVWAF